MNIIKKPFVNYTLDEDKEDKEVEVISIKINKQERETIERLKRYTNYGQDGKVLKIGLIVLEKVILSNFGEVLFSKLTNNERRKPIFEKDKETKIN